MQTMELDVESGEAMKKLNLEPKSHETNHRACRFPTDGKYICGIERQPGVKEAASTGFYAQQEHHILTYDPSQLRPALVPFLDRELTVCNTFDIWLYHLGFLLYALLLMFYFAYTSFGDGSMGAGSACSDDNTNQNLNMCKLDDVLSDAKSDFRFLIAFVLAGYVGVSVQQWAMRRSNYAALCGTWTLDLRSLLALPLMWAYFRQRPQPEHSTCVVPAD
jgi:hypothetical protein